jgi:hypothetical protein
MTSVGAGSLMIVALLLLHPSLKAGQLVGTDLVQAVPLVASAPSGTSCPGTSPWAWPRASWSVPSRASG